MKNKRLWILISIFLLGIILVSCTKINVSNTTSAVPSQTPSESSMFSTTTVPSTTMAPTTTVVPTTTVPSTTVAPTTTVVPTTTVPSTTIPPTTSVPVEVYYIIVFNTNGGSNVAIQK